MTQTPARRSDWWPGRWISDWLDWPDWPGMPGRREGDRMLRVEEYRDDDTLVVRTELPGIDPERDLELDVRDNMLEMRAQRREEKTMEEQGSRRTEFRYGSFYRVIPLPREAKSDDVTASYKDGILEVRVPCAANAAESTRRIQVERS